MLYLFNKMKSNTIIRSLRPSILLKEYSRPTTRSISPTTLRMHNDLLYHMYELVYKRTRSCTCTGKMHLHQAMTFEDSGSIVPLTYGQNMIRDIDKSIHAEHDAIMRLPQRYSRKLLPINIFVIKTTMGGVVGMSKPCAHCLTLMTTLPQKLGYRIANIFYTNSSGDIERKKLSELMSEEMHISKLFTATGFKVRPTSPSRGDSGA